MMAEIVDAVRVVVMVAAAGGAVIASLLAVGLVWAFGWYARSVYRGE